MSLSAPISVSSPRMAPMSVLGLVTLPPVCLASCTAKGTRSCASASCCHFIMAAYNSRYRVACLSRLPSRKVARSATAFSAHAATGTLARSQLLLNGFDVEYCSYELSTRHV